ncbi:MAG: ATP-dependent zinc metalloprotease FtsH [Clostridia bacterium]|nr:ATP-dependent zinc metalloprotease FtsH [Clostridia bacterium]
MKKFLKNIGFYVLLFAIFMTVLSILTVGDQPEIVKYSDFVVQFKAGEIKSITYYQGENRVEAVHNSKGMEKNIEVVIPSLDTMNQDLGVDISKYMAEGKDTLTYSVVPPQTAPWWFAIISPLGLIIIAVLFWVFFMRQAGGGGGAMAFGKSKARMTDPSKATVTFDDVAGADEEKEELKEVVDFLKNPQKYHAIGARIPKGLLLVGPPGTGKTLLAKACAGEAGVPFFSISGSDFVEMFVGVGASRVRDLFENAKKASPCIIFIDEIDAVGRHRGAGLGGGHDEREQTLNQLLVEMDGFTENQNIIIVAATNRPDILDPALLRPGRFDRQLVVNYPDVKGREEILKVHSRKKPLASDVDLSVIAKTTAGFTGADLENLLNESALLAARENRTQINMQDVSEAMIKVIAGPEKKSKKASEKEKSLTAYHEAGHAIVTKLLPNQDPVHQISIIPRGRAGGYTLSLPSEDKMYASKVGMMEEIVVLLGGRVAEKLVLDDISTGASNDIQRATKIAREMITKYGMSEKLGPICFGSEQDEVFIGKDFGQTRNYSEQVASQIDEEIKAVIDSCYEKCQALLSDNMELLHELAKLLLEKEKVEGDEFLALYNKVNGIVENPSNEETTQEAQDGNE